MFRDFFIFSIIVLFACHQKETHQRSTLVEGRYNVAFLITNGVYNTEFTAPYDIFQHTQYRKGIKSMNVFTVSNQDDPIRTFEGIYVQPDFNFKRDSIPPIDILVVPSAEHHLDSDLENQDLLNFIRNVDKRALYVTSHCDGAFMLAKAGILEGQSSTTFPSDIGQYRQMFPKLDVLDSVIFVHDGKYITSVGGMRSFDAALYLIELLYGKDIASSIAKGLVIDWDLEKIKYVKK
jgi:transcriptional regulator GlxA family with amidase domain